MNFRATLKAAGSGAALTCFGALWAGLFEIGELSPFDPWK